MTDNLHTTVPPIATPALGWWTVTGAASAHAALSDSSDSSYVAQTLSSGAQPYLQLRFGPGTTLDPSGRVTYLQLNFRAKQVPAQVGPLRFDIMLPGVGIITAETLSNGLFGFPITFGLRFPIRPGGGAWTIADMEDLWLFVLGPTGTVTTLFEVSLSAYVNYAPTALPAGPISPLTTTSFPVFGWNYSDSESDAQEMIELKVFSGVGALDPSTETARLVGTTGQIFTSSSTVNGPGGMSFRNGAYRWAVRAKDVGSPSGFWGSWGQTFLTVNTPAPDPAVLEATPDPELARYEITLDTGGGTYPPEFFWLERSDDSGATWSTVRGGTAIAYDGEPVTFYDYEAPRMAREATVSTFAGVGYNEPVNYNAPLNYNAELVSLGSGPPNVVRYRVSAGRILAGETLYANYTVIEPDSLLSDRSTWLKHPFDSTRNMRISHLANWETTSEEQLASLRAAGRADWAIFGDVPSLEKGDIDIIFPGDEAWAAFELLRTPPYPQTIVPLLLQSCFGDTVLEQMWVRLGPNRSVTRVTHTNQNVLQYRRGKVGFFQMLRPEEL